MGSSSLITDNKGKRFFFLNLESLIFLSKIEEDLKIKEWLNRLEFFNKSLLI